MKEYHVTLIIRDCTSVDAESEAEAKQIAIDIFKENGYNMDRGYELEIEEGDKYVDKEKERREWLAELQFERERGN